MKYNISSQYEEEERGKVTGFQVRRLLLRTRPGGGSVTLHTGRPSYRGVIDCRFYKCFKVRYKMQSLNLNSFHCFIIRLGYFWILFTWSYAEASDDPNNTAHTDVTQEGQLGLSRSNTSHESTISVSFVVHFNCILHHSVNNFYH